MTDKRHPTRQNPVARSLRLVGRTRRIPDKRARAAARNAKKQMENGHE